MATVLGAQTTAVARRRGDGDCIAPIKAVASAFLDQRQGNYRFERTLAHQSSCNSDQNSNRGLRLDGR